MFSHKNKKKDAGSICIGFAVLMAGMNMMGSAVSPLADSPAFVSFMTAFRNPGPGRSGRRGVYGNHSELLRFRRNSAGAFPDREHYIWDSNPHHHGAEYRNLRYGADLQHRRQ